ncbi:general stress protein [Alkalibacterium olivapovliticus]|uniref:Heat induced stress protein YflT n=1 Tax=Alkalibacterium olivapovliticus TaxID=99907 RepID=A0A2T0WAJ0_9LACT|nr:general stress protein [Alkalibacterium olivapovliticus]PRY83723.1 heat induced stress protein YflT [Alkalibacterium olivapovliticus]
MEKDFTVIGSYPTEEEAEHVIRRLLKEGTAKQDITIFTNKDKSDRLNNTENVDVSNADVNDDKDHDDDKSFWESIKDAFSVRDDEYYEDPNYVVEDDSLHMYRDDLKKGHVVVTIQKNGGQDSGKEREATSSTQTHAGDPDLETLGTTAGFPNEGSVQGMGDGGQPPMEPKTNDGTPPELEDTHGEADVDASTDERLRQTRKKDLDS